jgi:hypothetical protein
MSWPEVNCPCIDCILIAICRHKYFVDLKNDCELVEQFLFEGMAYNRRREDFDYRIYQVFLAIKPTKWVKEGATFKWKKRARVKHAYL